jgi:hypothetical protein
MATLASITARVQALCNDQDVAVLTQAFLLPYINAAQEELTQRLRSAGVARMLFSSTLDVPANTTVITKTSTPALPALLDEPAFLFEKNDGADVSTFRPMIGPQELPDVPQQSSLIYWNWVSGTITFVGATTARDVRVEYYGDLSAFTDSTDDVAISGSVNAISYLTAAAVMLARDANTSALLKPQANYYVDMIINEHIKATQTLPVRRRPARAFGRYLNRF